MKKILNSLDAQTRRQFVERCAATSFGLSILPTAHLTAANSSDPKPAAFGKAKSVIWLMLNGGLSHIDSLDPKQGKSKGPAKAINTSADFQVTEFFPKLATVANRVCVIRSMEAKIGVHKPAQYFMRTAMNLVARFYTRTSELGVPTILAAVAKICHQVCASTAGPTKATVFPFELRPARHWRSHQGNQ